ncbi:MAG: amino acid amidase [Acholeplasmataceae bacterium]|nr:amino acid amidase [Acholeplasmataceae bacterium]
MNKVFISADIEGVNNICAWSETDKTNPDYAYFKKQMTAEVFSAVRGAKRAGIETIFVKDAHDSGRNIDPESMPEEVILHRGWEGAPEMMMEGLDKSYGAVIFIGYHSGMLDAGNSLSHTLNPKIHRITINGEVASEFLINAYYASSLNIPIAFLSGDEELTKKVQALNPNIAVCATKTGRHGASISRHPNLTNKEIEEKVFLVLQKDLTRNVLKLPDNFDVQIEYRHHQEAFSASFFPGCKLLGSNKIQFKTKDYYDVLVLLKFVC